MTDPDRAPRRSRPVLRILVIAGILLLLVAGGLIGWAWWRVLASLPRLDGQVAVQGISDTVTITRDAVGVPTVRGSSRADVARAVGFLHAQDRFFQMDLLRRRASGSLAELFGAAALPLDRTARRHRFDDVARRVVDAAPAERRRLIDAYAAGVNAGLADLGGPPFEYLLLRTDPAPWTAEDTVLASLAMFLDLNDENGSYERVLGAMADTLPPELFAFLTPAGTEWDAPVAGAARTVPDPPAADVVDLRTAAAPPSAGGSDAAGLAPGSNSWAVAGDRTADGRALVANDMHLGLSVPNTWYRLSIRYPGPDGDVAVTGVSLPGTPLIIVGSNTRVAWGFTNSYGDWTDVVVVEPDPSDSGRYLVPGGSEPFRSITETIRVNGAPDETVDIRWTRWGPVVATDAHGRAVALRWTAHDPAAVDLDLLDLETADNVDQALDAAARAGIPPQNFVCADASGRIGWTIAGAIPRRVGWDGRLPGSWADGSRRWDGWIDPSDTPRIVTPAGGLIWTANARVVDGHALAVIGDGGYALGARARQIHDDLTDLGSPTEADMLAIQLDDRAEFLGRWHDLLLRAVDAAPSGGNERRDALRAAVAGWGARADVGSAGYRIVRAFRLEVIRRAVDPLLAPCRAVDERCTATRLRQVEGPVWRLVTERPAHLLSPRYASWNDLLIAAADAVAAELSADGAPLRQATWGRRNTTRIRHPLSRALPALSRWLDMEPVQLPGDGNMPRVQAPAFGASERMVVSPGREQDGVLHMPGGQSGHPLSPFYRAGHRAWVEGAPTPFLPGPPVHTLELRPVSRIWGQG